MLLNHALAQEGDLIFGVAVGDGARYANAAVSIGVSPSRLYNKPIVPFGEFVPPGFQWFLDRMRIPMSNFTPGPVRQETDADRRTAHRHQHLLRKTSLAPRSSAPRRRRPCSSIFPTPPGSAIRWRSRSILQIAQLRALETGRPMLRATTTGMTAGGHAGRRGSPPCCRPSPAMCLVAEVQVTPAARRTCAGERAESALSPACWLAGALTPRCTAPRR